MIRDDVTKAVLDAVKKVAPGIEVPVFSVEMPENYEFGDYATNAAMMLAKLLEKPPMEIARVIAAEIDDQRFEKAGAVAPGFINIRLKDDFLISKISEVNENWGKSDIGKGKTVMVEYFQLNIAKRPHVGHLRSAVIGDAIKRMLLSQGYKAVSDTHVGDWGTQFGILIQGYKRAGKPDVKGDPFDVLEEIYQKESSRIEANPELREAAKAEFSKLEKGDKENRDIWKWMVDVSMEKLNESAERLGLLPFDEHKGESSYEADMPAIVEAAIGKSVAKKKEDGAIIVDLTAEKLDEGVLIKSDGASTYLLRDIASVQYWKNAFSLYVVDVRQAHHLKQLFRVAELLGIKPANESRHVEFGFMSLPDGAISTRKGNVISLDAVIDEAERRALAAIEEKNPELKNKEEVAKIVGRGAIKYFDLSHHRKSDIVFRWETALAFEGNTGPYIQYTYARLKSILRKAGSISGAANSTELDVTEHALLASVFKFSEVVEDALKDYTPNTIANYLFILASRVNEFYHSHPVIQETDLEKRAMRIKIVEAVSQTIKNSLFLLGIEAPEEM